MAWELAVRLLHSPVPALAALAAIITVQVTVKQTVTRGIQFSVGVTVGVSAAVLLVGFLGVHTWTVGLVVLGALLLGNVLRLGAMVNQVAISGLLVLALGTGYGWERVWDTLLGAAVGVLVNVLVVPPTHVESATRSLRRIGEDLALLTTEVGDGLRADWGTDAARGWLRQARDIDRDLHGTGDEVDRAEESLRYNPRARADAEALARLVEAFVAFEHVSTQLRGMARTLVELAAELPLPAAEATALAAYADLLGQAGTATAAFARAQTGGPGTREELRRAHAAAVDAAESTSAALRPVPSGDPGRTITSLYVDARRLLHEIDPDAGAHTGAL